MQARNLWDAMAQANRQICSDLRRPQVTSVDPKGRIDVHDPEGAIVARIYCADTLAELS